MAVVTAEATLTATATVTAAVAPPPEWGDVQLLLQY